MTVLYPSMSRRAELVANTLNSIDGIQCNTVQGAMYAFPQVQFIYLSTGLIKCPCLTGNEGPLCEIIPHL